MKAKQVLMGGVAQNPVFVLVLGMCPVLAMSSSLQSALGLGASTVVVLVMSNFLIALFRNVIPDKVRIPCYIIIIATLVTVVDMFMARFASKELYSAVGSFIKLITVNCIILARAEAFANSNKAHLAALDGLTMGLGFLVAICLLGAVREILGAGSIMGYKFITLTHEGAELDNFLGAISFSAGGFLTLGILMAVFNKVYSAVSNRLKTHHSTPTESGASTSQSEQKGGK